MSHNNKKDQINHLVAMKLYKASVLDKITHFLLEEKTPVLLYGPQSVGKTYLAKHLLKPQLESQGYYVQYIDCNALSAQLTNADYIDHALDYILAQYSQAMRMTPSLLILDNLHALTPAISTDGGEQFNILDYLKSLKITALLQRLIEREEVAFLGIARHYMSLNTKMLDIGIMDTLVEMQAPGKEARYGVVKELIADEGHRGREVWMQKVA